MQTPAAAGDVSALTLIFMQQFSPTFDYTDLTISFNLNTSANIGVTITSTPSTPDVPVPDLPDGDNDEFSDGAIIGIIIGCIGFGLLVVGIAIVLEKRALKAA